MKLCCKGLETAPLGSIVLSTGREALSSLKAMTVTVNLWTDEGPYHAPSLHCYKVDSLAALIGEVKEAMENNAQYIGIMKDGECLGFWEDDSEPEPDGEGGWYFPRQAYVLRRPNNGGHFDTVTRLLRQASSKLA